MKIYAFLTFLLLVLTFNKTSAQEKINGPILMEYGSNYTVLNPDLAIDTTQTFKAVFDLSETTEDAATVNAGFERVARFINLHAQAGIPLKNIKPVMVVHGGAVFGLLKNEYYKEKFGVDNPNLDVLNKLDALNVPVVLCGQTAGAREISKEKRWPQTQLALSAMTALIHYQNLGYALINF